MKQKLFPIVFAIAAFFCTDKKIQAQQTYGGNYRSGSSSYYYFPEIDTWYDISNHRFVYFENGRWVISRALSNKYRNYNTGNGYRILINEPQPYVHAADYRMRYVNYYNTYNTKYIQPNEPAEARVYRNERPNYAPPAQEEARRTYGQNKTFKRSPSANEKIAERVPQENNKRIEPAKPAESPVKTEERVALPEQKHIEPVKPIEPPATVEEPVVILPEHKRIEPAEIQLRDRKDHSQLEYKKTEQRAKAEKQLQIAPIKPKTVEVLKTDTVPAPVNMIQMGKGREAQYSDRFKKINPAQ